MIITNLLQLLKFPEHLIIIVLLACVFFTSAKYQYLLDKEKTKLELLSQQLNKQNASIDEWAKQAREADEHMQLLQKRAAGYIKESKQETQDIMELTVPKACEKAIEWGISQAISMKAQQ